MTSSRVGVGRLPAGLCIKHSPSAVAPSNGRSVNAIDERSLTAAEAFDRANDLALNHVAAREPAVRDHGKRRIRATPSASAAAASHRPAPASARGAKRGWFVT